MWHETRDTWQVVTRDMWHVTCFGVWTFSQNFSSLALTVCDLWYYEDLEEKDDSLNQSISDEAVYRTAPATPGLLNIGKCLKPIQLRQWVWPALAKSPSAWTSPSNGMDFKFSLSLPKGFNLSMGKNYFWGKTWKSFFLPYSWYGKAKKNGKMQVLVSLSLKDLKLA